MLFKNRETAGLKLIPFLKKYEGKDVVVLAIPRGGLPVAYPVAKEFGFSMDVILTKKIGHPFNPELAIGAVSLEDCIVDTLSTMPDKYLETEINLIRKTLQEKYRFYMGHNQPLDLKEKIVIIIDDGVATGYTMKATIKLVQRKLPSKIVVAVPVAPPRTADELENLVDDFICLARPSDFTAVGQYYFDFSKVSDAEALAILKKSKKENA